jgi:hypothetical protein
MFADITDCPTAPAWVASRSKSGRRPEERYASVRAEQHDSAIPCRQPGGFDRPLPMPAPFPVAQAVQSRDPSLEATGHQANVGFNMPTPFGARCRARIWWWSHDADVAKIIDIVGNYSERSPANSPAIIIEALFSRYTSPKRNRSANEAMSVTRRRIAERGTAYLAQTDEIGPMREW